MNVVVVTKSPGAERYDIIEIKMLMSNDFSHATRRYNSQPLADPKLFYGSTQQCFCYCILYALRPLTIASFGPQSQSHESPASRLCRYHGIGKKRVRNIIIIYRVFYFFSNAIHREYEGLCTKSNTVRYESGEQCRNPLSTNCCTFRNF